MMIIATYEQMAKPLCMNNTNSDANQYSSPVPLIGLYIAGATLVCLLLMVLDAISGLRRKNLYIPCRFFSLNSATLTLIGVASKLSVDLTTYMPSAIDQLSKLTGTAMVCICIGFFMPSLGINSESESIANLIALSLLVITIFVNICIQMSTEVIFSFLVEHIMILCCMLTLLFMLLCSTLGNKRNKSLIFEERKFRFSNSKESLMHRLKRWYISSCMYNPQLLLCNDFSGVAVDIICISCLVIVSQAAIRSLILHKFEFCEGISDYGWSMWMIIITQIVTIIIGGLTISFRWLALILMSNKFKHHIHGFPTTSKLTMLRYKFKYINIYGILGDKFIDFFLQFNAMKTRSVKKFIVSISQMLLKFGLSVMFILIFFIIAFVPLLLSIILVRFIEQCFSSSNKKTSEDESIISWIEKVEYHSPIYLYEVSEWMTRQCMKDMNKWMMNGKKRSGDSTNKHYMVQMLSTPRPSSGEIVKEYYSKEDDEVRCLSMVLLVKILSISIPLDLTRTLRHTLDEAFEIIYYIDEKINIAGFDDQRRRQLAKLLWTSGDINPNKDDLIRYPYGSVNYVKSVVSSFARKSPDLLLTGELSSLLDFIQRREHSTVEELCDYCEQLFVGMLHSFLVQLPNVIFKEVNLSQFEEHEGRARAIIKILCELEPSLEDKVQWAFPEGANVAGLFDSQDHGTATIQNSTIKEDVDAMIQRWAQV